MFYKKLKNKIKSYFVKPYYNSKNKELLEIFKNYNTCYILGSSPSINKLNLSNLDKNAMKISMGNFYEHPNIENINPSIHLFAASHPPITEEVLTNWWTRCNDVLPKKTPILVEKKDEITAKKVFTERKIYIYAYGGSYPIDFTKQIISPWSVSLIALQLVAYCKIKTIFLLGIDHDWQCIKPYHHFYSHDKPSLEYYLKTEDIKISYEEQKQPFPKERLYREYELYQQYESLKLYGDTLNIKIYNADPYSNFDVFDKKSIEFNVYNK